MCQFKIVKIDHTQFTVYYGTEIKTYGANGP